MPVLYGIAAYVALGLTIGLAFVSFGVTQVVPHSMTLGARILVLPGAAALWPYVLLRWLKARPPA